MHGKTTNIFLQKTQSFFQHLPQQGPVLLALSGGKDSIALAHVLHTAGISFQAAHCNFSLRGEESDGDEQYVKSFCRSLGLVCHSTRFDTRTYAETHGISTQMAARDLRYTWFEDLRKHNHLTYTATAHHHNDHVETMLLNLIRGTGPAGLAGIAEVSGSIIRPLLWATRTDIDAYIAENHLTWREDSSNSHDDYHRNFIRHHIIPLIATLNPGWQDTFTRTGHRMAEADAIISEQADTIRKSMTEKNGVISFPLDKIKHAPALLLEYVLEDFQVNRDTVENLLLALHGAPGKRFMTPSNTLVVDRDTLIVYTKEENDFNEISIPGLGVFGQLTITEADKTTDPQSHAFSVIMDADKVKFPLIKRAWKQGDSIAPLGMGGRRKKVADLLNDYKVPTLEKPQVCVLEDATGEIIWVVGYRISDKVKLTTDTKRGYQFQVMT